MSVDVSVVVVPASLLVPFVVTVPFSSVVTVPSVLSVRLSVRVLSLSVVTVESEERLSDADVVVALVKYRRFSTSVSPFCGVSENPEDPLELPFSVVSVVSVPLSSVLDVPEWVTVESVF